MKKNFVLLRRRHGFGIHSSGTDQPVPKSFLGSKAQFQAWGGIALDAAACYYRGNLDLGASLDFIVKPSILQKIFQWTFIQEGPECGDIKRVLTEAAPFPLVS